ncbi:MAG TPA: glycosyltransferase [Herpetosiphonaceae bacterium]
MSKGSTMPINPSPPAVGTSPLVSAIVSTYNAERFIWGCLEDLEAQTIASRLEIIVVDSGSSQHEGAIVKEFQQRYDNIVYLRTDQRESMYAAWNRGIQAARGTYITNANTDDRHRRDAFERMAAVLDTRPEVALVYADASVTRTENETFAAHTPVASLNWPAFDPLELLRRCCVGPQPMWRKSMHTIYGSFDASFEVAGDWEFWLRMAEHETFVHLPEVLGLYLSSPGGAENRNHALLGQENARVYQRYAHRADQRTHGGTGSGLIVGESTPVKQATDGAHQPAVSCICLTYARPGLLEEAIESFLRQDYAGPKELIVLNDYDRQWLVFEHPEVRVINLPTRVRSVGEKRNLAVALAAHDVLVVWDDDDICLPHRLSFSMAHFNHTRGFFKADRAWVWNDGQLSGPNTNNYHGVSCWSRTLFDAVRGYAAAGSGEDMAFEQRLEQHVPGSTRPDTIRPEDIYYLYRWGGTGSYHLSSFGYHRPGANIGHHEVEAHIRWHAAAGQIRHGHIQLTPRWKQDYQQVVADYLESLLEHQP